MPEQEWHFETTAERDAFIAREFPERKCLDVPGCYAVAGGRTLRIFLTEVTLYPNTDEVGDA